MQEGLLLERREHAQRNHLFVALNHVELFDAEQAEEAAIHERGDTRARLPRVALASDLDVLRSSLSAVASALRSGEGRISLVEGEDANATYELLRALERMEQTLFHASPPFARVTAGALRVQLVPWRDLDPRLQPIASTTTRSAGFAHERLGTPVAETTAARRKAGSSAARARKQTTLRIQDHQIDLDALAISWIELALIAMTQALAAHFVEVQIELEIATLPAAQAGKNRGANAADGSSAIDTWRIDAKLSGSDPRRGSAIRRAATPAAIDGFLLWLADSAGNMSCAIDRVEDSARSHTSGQISWTLCVRAAPMGRGATME